MRQPCNRRRRAEAKRERGREGRASREGASERAPRLLAGTAAWSEVARGALRELLPARAAPGSAAPPGPGGASLSAATGGSCQKFFAVLLPGRKAGERFGQWRFCVTWAPEPRAVFSRTPRKGLSKVEGIPHFSMRTEGCLAARTQGKLRGASQLRVHGQVEINGRTHIIPPGLDKAKHSPPGNLSSLLGGWRSLPCDTRGGDLFVATDAKTACASLLARVRVSCWVDSDLRSLRGFVIRAVGLVSPGRRPGAAPKESPAPPPPYLSCLHNCGDKHSIKPRVHSSRPK